KNIRNTLCGWWRTLNHRKRLIQNQFIDNRLISIKQFSLGLPFKKIRMAEFVLFDDEKRSTFLPLTYTRSVADFRWGIRTIKEKWAAFVNKSVFIKTVDYLQPLYGTFPENAFFVN